MKGINVTVHQLIFTAGLIVLAIMFLQVSISWASGGEHIQRGIEEASLIYTIANSVNAMSSSEQGEITRDLSALFDIDIKCSDSCSVSTAVYDESGKRMKETDEIDIMGNVVPTSLHMINRITLRKEPGEDVVITGERVEHISGELVIPQHPVSCITANPDIKAAIEKASERYGIDEDLIAAIIETESSWETNAHRYEPNYQLDELEGTAWENDDAWMDEGKSIEQWFSENPKRKEIEYANIIKNYPQKNLDDIVAQTRVSASYGLMQVLYTTGHDFCKYKGDPEGLYEPEVNIDCGAKYIKWQLERYKNQIDAVSAYNGGNSIWDSNYQNREYTANVMGYYNAYQKC